MTIIELQRALRSIAVHLASAEDELNSLDAVLGDGDCGSTVATMARGIALEVDALPSDLGDALKRIADVLGRVSGSSLSGVLMAGLLRAGSVLKGRSEILEGEMSNAIVESMAAMSARGGAKLGDKSILDGMATIVGALGQQVSSGEPPAARADEALAATLAHFRSKPCRIGRARVAGERSIGRDDPGMVALKRVMEAIRRSHVPSQCSLG